MKKIILFSVLLISALSFGQVPQGISYQAIALDVSGNPVVSSNVGLRLSILDNSATGSVLYTETHTRPTNAQGLFNLVIGQGTPTVGTFSAIKWETNSKFLKVEMDATGGTNYLLVGTTQLLSVPYAMFAGKVDTENITGGPDLDGSFTEWYSSSFMTSTNAYAFSPNDSTYDSNSPPSPTSWHSTAISGTPLMKSQNSFLTSTNVYIYGYTDYNNPVNSWHSYPISGQPIKIKSYNGATIVLTSTNAYTYFMDSNNVFQWTSTTISGNFIDLTSSIASFGLLTSTNAYAFVGGTWQSTTITGTPLKAKYVIDGIMFLTSDKAYIYGIDMYNTGGATPTYSWHTIPYSGTLLLD